MVQSLLVHHIAFEEVRRDVLLIALMYLDVYIARAERELISQCTVRLMFGTCYLSAARFCTGTFGDGPCFGEIFGVDEEFMNSLHDHVVGTLGIRRFVAKWEQKKAVRVFQGVSEGANAVRDDGCLAMGLELVTRATIFRAEKTEEVPKEISCIWGRQEQPGNRVSISQ